MSDENINNEAQNTNAEPPKLKKIEIHFADISIMLEGDEPSPQMQQTAWDWFTVLCDARLRMDAITNADCDEDSGELQDKTKPIAAETNFHDRGYHE